MKKLCLLLPVLILGACAGHTPPDLSAVKRTLYEYKSSGEYARDVEAFYQKTQTYVLSAAKGVERPAIVMDIDETSLSNWESLKANDLTFKLPGPCDNLPEGPCGLDAYHKQARCPVITPALRLYNAAKEHGIAVFFITGRRDYLRDATIKNLKAAGYKDWDGLTLRPKTPKQSAALYKAPARAAIEKKGYTIIATIGDQESDLKGGHAGRTFRVPNPYYNLP